ncbi:MAG: bifunctional 3-deoxy-7-phosphoheptulonate synthase/chorismate mutase [Tissierellia bacterium]|nr:bifunctional 3-deoxy-7-phosphoheptulonate synthase/chorismate mutase [Tissierellia bacterium]
MTDSIKMEYSLELEKGFNIIAGPCAVESVRQMEIIGEFLNKLDIKFIRGGAFKPRTSPSSFQGLGIKGLKILGDIKDSYGFRVVSEVLDPRDVEKAYDYIDIYQIGSRNMQNYPLLIEVGKTDKPVLLKRGMSATFEEWIKASEYIAMGGNQHILLCERGIRSFDDYTRNTLDLMSIPIIQGKTGYPIFIDPSHGTGRKELILPAVRAALVLGANGVMIEVHPEPAKALSDGIQSLNFKEFELLLNNVKKLEQALDEDMVEL